MIKTKKILIFISIFAIILIPSFSFAQTQADPKGNLVPCGGTAARPEQCSFKHVLILINKVITYFLFILVLPISAIMFAYAGFLLLTSGGETSQRSKAKKIFTNVAIGLIIAILSWLIVKFILDLLGFDGSWIGF